MPKKNDDKLNVVIVGGGGAGSIAARSLSGLLDPNKYNIILINPLPFRTCLPATARIVVSGKDNTEGTAFVPYDKLFIGDNGTFVQGKVASIQPSVGGDGGHIILESGDKLSYKILMLSTGALWETPLSFPDKEDEIGGFLENIRSSIRESQDVVLVGGGAVGIELSGEIKDIWPEKNVTIVHAEPLLMNQAYPDKFRVALESRVRARGIQLVFNDYIDDSTMEPPAATVTTRAGKAIKADCILNSRGPRPNTEFIAKSLGSDVLDDHGLVKLKPTLQLADHPHIFAAGDIVNFKEQKQVAKAQAHAAVVAANIVALLESRPLKPYKGSTEMIVVTLGKDGGVGYFDILWGIILGDWFARLVKSRTLAVPAIRGYMGY